jgi:hypothetical protein
VRRIVVIAKGKSVIGVKPAKIKVATILSFANLDHDVLVVQSTTFRLLFLDLGKLKLGL